MCGQEDFIVNIVTRLKRLDDDQSELDSVCSDLLEGLKSGLKEVHGLWWQKVAPDMVY